MSALTQPRMADEFRAKKLALPLAIGAKAFKNGRACFDYVAGTCKQAQAGASLQSMGEFQDTYDNTTGSATVFVLVDLDEEIVARYYDNDTGSPVAAANIGQIAYFLDDHTVSLSPTSNCVAGRIWDVDGIKGVAVQAVDTQETIQPIAALTAFAAGATAPASIQHDAIYDVPATAAASTITLPAAAPDGTRAMFCADGVKNANTVQYIDATGPTNLTTALTATKRHLVIVVKENGKWFANAYVGP